MMKMGTLMLFLMLFSLVNNLHASLNHGIDLESKSQVDLLSNHATSYESKSSDKIFSVEKRGGGGHGGGGHGGGGHGGGGHGGGGHGGARGGGRSSGSSSHAIPHGGGAHGGGAHGGQRNDGSLHVASTPQAGFVIMGIVVLLCFA